MTLKILWMIQKILYWENFLKMFQNGPIRSYHYQSQGGHSCTDVLICTYLYWEQKCTAKCTDKSLFWGDVLLNVLGFLMFIPHIDFYSFSFLGYLLCFATISCFSWFSRFHYVIFSFMLRIWLGRVKKVDADIMIVWVLGQK